MSTTYTINPETIDLTDVDHIVKHNLKIKLSSSATQKVAQGRDFLEKKLTTHDRPIYGINTGFGSLCDVEISKEKLAQLQLNLVRSHACGMGDQVSEEISRTILLLKIINASIGHSGCSPELMDRMIALFNAGVVPTIYELGSLGASGDLAPLAHLALTLIGEDHAHPDIEPLALKEKEGLALLNGTQFSLAHGVKALNDMTKLMEISHVITAMSLDAFRCDQSPFDADIHRIRPHYGQQYVADKIRAIRSESPIAALPLISVQDPYSFRCVPQVHGASYDAMRHAREVFTIELRSVTDNPLVFPEGDKIISGGNFHAQPLAMVLDYLGMAAAEMASIAERRIYQLIGGLRGLPDFLVDDAGMNSGFMITQYTAASIVSQNKQLATPASIDSIVSCKGQEDHVSMAANAATKVVKIVNNYKRVLAIELLVAAQALDYRRPHQSAPEVERLHSKLREVVPFYEEDRIMHVDLTLAEGILEQAMSEYGKS